MTVAARIRRTANLAMASCVVLSAQALVRVALVLAAFALVMLPGCRAFQPEAILVNKPPETFIMGAPTGDGGGYYRFHVFWYGRDEDGRVERFLWALTDSTVQDPETSDDEENQRFNPALNASTMAIGHWTTRTDSTFNFTIDQGDNPSAEKTLHFVAMDDRGAFDRSPARLHFFTNSLGNPGLRFFRVSGADTVELAAGQVDTVGYGHRYQVLWRGLTPNVRGFGAAALEALDTMPPLDGLLGYKWRIRGALGGNCDEARDDCWHPRKFNEATGDSFSYWGPATSLTFANDGSDQTPFGRRLPSAKVSLEVNSIDIAGVEAAISSRPFNFIVNFDPQTLILNGERDWAHPEDPESYPYYIQLNDPAQAHHPFRAGDRIPDRTYVVVKALARDDERDILTDPSYRIGFTGFLQGSRQNYSGGVFNFTSEASAINRNPAWGPGAGGWYGDTLGFLTGPSSSFTINMLSIDEWERRDGTPSSLSFDVGYAPCLQCIELIAKPGTQGSAFDGAVACVEDPADVAAHPCLADTADLRITLNGAGPNELQFYRTTTILVNRDTGFMKVTDSPATGELAFNYVLPARLYKLGVLLHGQDDAREAWAEPVRRMGGWRYEVAHDCDLYNALTEGGGNDDIRIPTWGPINAQVINTATGVWKLEVDVAVPTLLVSQGPEVYRAFLYAAVAGGNQEAVDMIMASVTQQYGAGWVEAVALDQTACGLNPDRPARFNFFRNVRPATSLPAGLTWRDCALDAYIGPQIKDRLPLSLGAMASNDGQPVRKHFRLTLVTPTGDVGCGAGAGAAR